MSGLVVAAVQAGVYVAEYCVPAIHVPGVPLVVQTQNVGAVEAGALLNTTSPAIQGPFAGTALAQFIPRTLIFGRVASMDAAKFV